MTQGRVALPGIIRCIRIMAPECATRASSSVVVRRPSCRRDASRARSSSARPRARPSPRTRGRRRRRRRRRVSRRPAFWGARGARGARVVVRVLLVGGARDARRADAHGRVRETDERSRRTTRRTRGVRARGCRTGASGTGGGCSGSATSTGAYAEREGDAEGGDRVFRAENGAEVVVDDVSYEFVRGATIDYVDEMIKSF